MPFYLLILNDLVIDKMKDLLFQLAQSPNGTPNNVFRFSVSKILQTGKFLVNNYSA